MLRIRVAIILLVLPLVAWVVYLGDWPYVLTVGGILGLAAIEYARLFLETGFRPAIPILVGGVCSMVVIRFLIGFDNSPFLLSAVCLITLVWHLIDYERGAPHSGTDFAITLGGIIYIGWIGSYLISLRLMTKGLWWFLLVVPTIWLVDSASYLVGKKIGRHKMSLRLSPNKSWEGYIAGIVAGVLGGVGLTPLWRIGSGDPSLFTVQRGAILGMAIAILAPLGDLGVSMMKREHRVKDTGKILPGHGGALDRLDTMLWACVIAYYLIAGFTA